MRAAWQIIEIALHCSTHITCREHARRYRASDMRWSPEQTPDDSVAREIAVAIARRRHGGGSGGLGLGADVYWSNLHKLFWGGGSLDALCGGLPKLLAVGRTMR